MSSITYDYNQAFLGTTTGTTSVKPVALTDAEFLTGRVKHWQGIMGLSDWKLETRIVPQLSKASAEVVYDSFRKQAIITMSEEVGREKWDFEIVHELAHLQLFEVNDVADRAIRAIGDEHPKAQEVLHEELHDAMERAVHLMVAALLGKPVPFVVKAEDATDAE